jgi:hypothetical protein
MIWKLTCPNCKFENDVAPDPDSFRSVPLFVNTGVGPPTPNAIESSLEISHRLLFVIIDVGVAPTGVVLPGDTAQA